MSLASASNPATGFRHLLCLFLLCLAPNVGAVEVIANRGVSVADLPLAMARALFGMRMTRWPDGRPVKVFVLPDSNLVHDNLCKEKLNLYPYQLRQSWDRLVFSGMAQAPTEVASEEEMLARIAATPGAIGYVRKVKTNDPVKVLHVQQE
jgi:hypothetical protein